MGRFCRISLMVALVASSYSIDSQAKIADPRIEGARQCTQQFARQERIHGIPSHLLAAISNTESGRWNDTLGMVLPWPWTINAEGKGYYFDSKVQAIAKVKELQAQGMRSIDIGCMQVNLRHHPDAFANLNQAFDPKYNVAYAAKYLRSHYDSMKQWNKAIARYHSATPKYGNKYLARVEKSWSAITGKVRTARAAMGDQPRRNRVSHRVIRVRDSAAGQQYANLDLTPNVTPSTASPLRNRVNQSIVNRNIVNPKTQRSQAETAPKSKMMRIRAVDRLSGGFRQRVALKRSSRETGRPSIRQISVKDAPTTPPSTTIIRPTSASREAISLTQNNAVDPSSAVSLTPRSFVTSHGVRRNSASQSSTDESRKPKFIFVQ